MGMVVKNMLQRIGRGLAAAVAVFVVLAGHAPEAAATWATQCQICHGALAGVSGSRINAAYSGQVIQRALDLGLMAVAGVDTTAIATEIGDNNGPYSQSVNINFNQTLNITVNKLVIPSNFINQLEQTSAVAGTNLPVANSTTFNYNHPATNCTSQVVTLRGREVSAGTLTNTRTVTININAPTLTATSAGYAIAYSTSAQSIDVGPNFNSNPAGAGPSGTLNIVGGLSPNLGSRAATGPATFTYASDATTYAPTVTQQYSIDGLTNCGISNTATATINVGPPPAPAVQSFAQTVPAVGATIINLDSPARITGVILSNPAGTYNVVASQPTAAGSGTTSVSGHQITYTPPGGAFTGTTTITYTKDGPGGTSNVGTITLTVTAAPVGSDANGGTTPFNTPIMVDVGPLLTGTFTSVASPTATNGSSSVSGSVVTFTPTPGFFGSGSFTYTATGPGGTSTPNTVTITVLPPPPVANSATVTGSFQTATPFDLTPFITGVTSPPPVAAFNAVSGTINSVAGNVVTFTPANGFIGAATFQYTASGPGGTSAPATVTVNVAAPPPPTVANLSVLVSATGPTMIDLASSISGFFNTVMISSPPLLGTATVNGSVVTYTPIANNPGTVTFQYVANGPGGTSAPAGTVTMTYTNAPVTPNRTLIVPFNTVTEIDLAAMTAGTFSSITIATQPTNGIVLVRGGVITYTPNPGYFGPDSFTYTATGPGGTSTPGRVSITVNPPTAQVIGGTITVGFDTPTPIDLSALTSGVATSFVITTQPANGTIAVSGNIATYTPRPGFFGADSFAFSAVNAAGASPPGTVNLTVGSLKPVAGAATMTVQLNSSASLDLAKFISGSGVTGVSISRQPAHGTVTVNGTTITYTPKRNFFGNDSFAYIAFGNLGSSAPGLVTVTVVGRPDPSLDPAVRGLVDAQSATPTRFTRAQVTNFQRRMETLHRGPDSAFPVVPPKAPPEPAASPSPQPSGALPGRPQALAPAAPSSSAPASLVSSLISLATSQSVGLNGASTLRDGTSIWIGGLAQFGDIDATGERSGMRFSTDGVSVGADRRVNDRLVLGLGVGHARDETRIGNDGSKSKARGSSLAVYGSLQPTPNTYIDSLFGFGKIDMDSSRYVEVIDAVATGRRKVDQVFGSVAAGYEWRSDGVLVSPYGRLDVSFDKLKRVSESGAEQYNLTFADQDQRSTQLAVGVRAEAQHEMEFGRVVPRVRAEYRRAFQGGRNASISYADLIGGPEYSVTATGVSRNSLLLGIGTDFLLSRGLKLGIDYQAERASGARNVQSVRLFVSQDLDFKGLSPFRFNTDMLDKPISIDAGFTHDDNVNRGRLPNEKLQDNIVSLGIGQERIYPLGDNLRLVATPLITAEKFRRFAGLGRFSGGIQGELQYRGSAAFDATTYAVRGSAVWDQYESRLRTGSRFFLGLNARRSITDKIDVFGEVGTNARYGRSDVFELRDYAAKANVDYSLGRNGVVYVSGEFRRGDTFSSGFPSLVNTAIAEVFVTDDAFDGDLVAYRVDARTILGTIGYNRPLGPRDSIDFSWRRVQSTPTTKPGFDSGSSLRYNNHQYSIVYLLRF